MIAPLLLQIAAAWGGFAVLMLALEALAPSAPPPPPSDDEDDSWVW